MQHYEMLPFGSQMQSSPGVLLYLIDIVVFEVKSKEEQNDGASDKRLFLCRLNMISVKNLNLPFTGRLIKSVAGIADITVKYCNCAHTQLPVMVSILKQYLQKSCLVQRQWEVP